jgi:phosphate:Na+ symporter
MGFNLQAIFMTAGGLSLFLFGMNMMTTNLKEYAGQKLRKILRSITSNPLAAFATGTVATAMVQSSSATTVMIIGLVNAGLLNLRQAICVIFGTNVGTTATAWIVSFTGFKLKLSTYSLLIIAIGFTTQIIAKTHKKKALGAILIGFGILFVGVDFMKDAFEVVRENPQVQELLIKIGDKAVLSLLAGLIITMLIQSSSAAIAIMQIMALKGAFGENWYHVVDIAVPYVIGACIGTTITAQLASLTTNIYGKRAAWSHSLFNIAGAVITLPFIYMGIVSKIIIYVSELWWQIGESTIMLTIAVTNTLFNVFFALLFLPFAGVYEKIVCKIVPAKKGDIAIVPVVLEEHLLNTPALALDQSRCEIIRMAKEAKRAVINAVYFMFNGDKNQRKLALKLEDLIDDFQHQITAYLTKLSAHQLSDEVARETPVLLHIVNDLERIGDHAINITELAERKLSEKLEFSEHAGQETRELIDELNSMFDGIIKALKSNNPADTVEPLASEKIINKMQVDYRRKHVKRMTRGECSPVTGILYIDMIDNLEKIADHLTNIAQAVQGGLMWDNIDEQEREEGLELNSMQEA